MKGILVEIFKRIPDPRKGNAIRHKLHEILIIAVLAIVCDYCTFTEMEIFGQKKEPWLRGFLDLENGIPSHDTFGDVFAAVSSESIESAFHDCIDYVRNKIDCEIVAIDGKTIKGSRDNSKNKKAVHVVSAWANSNGIVLGEKAVNAKSNEITAIPELLKTLDIENCIVTIDAMGTQKEIASAIIKKGADYVLAVKKNQHNLFDDLELFFQTERKECDYYSTFEKGHGRYEKRECWCTNDVEWMHQKDDWKGLSGIGMIRSERQIIGEETIEVAYSYVIYSKENMSAKEVLFAKRSHWGVENRLHWVLDVSFGEDNSRMREGNSAKNVNIIRHLAVSLLNKEKTLKKSLNVKRKTCTLDDEYLLKVITLL